MFETGALCCMPVQERVTGAGGCSTSTDSQDLLACLTACASQQLLEGSAELIQACELLIQVCSAASFTWQQAARLHKCQDTLC